MLRTLKRGAYKMYIKYMTSRIQPDATPLLQTKLTISQARDQLPNLVSSLEKEEKVIGIGPREELKAVLISAARFKELTLKEAHPEIQVAELLARRLLKAAPADLVDPQIREFQDLGLDQLAALDSIKKLPLTDAERVKVRARLENAVVLDRLEKRHRVATAIAEATTAGLYDTAEHRTSELESWTKDDVKEP